jgi:hypothetical protein
MTSRAPQRSLTAPTTREESFKEDFVEDRFIMKNYILITALAMLTGAIVLSPQNARAQSTPAQNAPAQDPKEIEFVGTWYDVCITKKPLDTEKCYQLSKELIEKYPNHSEKKYIEFAKRRIDEYIYAKAIEKFNTAFKKYTESKPDAANLDALLTAGDDFLEIETDPKNAIRLYVIAYQALFIRQALVAEVYKNYDRVKIYADRALAAYATLSPDEKDKKQYTEYNLFNLRDQVLAYMNQVLGYILVLTKPDQADAQDQAMAYIDKSLKVRSQEYKDIGWKDPYNYNMRRTIYTKRYTELRKQYDALTDEQKTGDTGKELLKQVNDLLDTKMIPELARIIAVANRPELAEVKTDATADFDNFWKFRVDDPTKAPPYLKSFEADPTVPGPPVPVKVDDGTGTGPAPTASGGTTKLNSGTAVPTAGSNGTKATSGKTTKGKTTPKRKSGRKR